MRGTECASHLLSALRGRGGVKGREARRWRGHHPSYIHAHFPRPLASSSSSSGRRRRRRSNMPPSVSDGGFRVAPYTLTFLLLTHTACVRRTCTYTHALPQGWHVRRGGGCPAEEPERNGSDKGVVVKVEKRGVRNRGFPRETVYQVRPLRLERTHGHLRLHPPPLSSFYTSF